MVVSALYFMTRASTTLFTVLSSIKMMRLLNISPVRTSKNFPHCIAVMRCAVALKNKPKTQKRTYKFFIHNLITEEQT